MAQSAAARNRFQRRRHLIFIQIVDDLHKLNYASHQHLARTAGVSYSTLYAWMFGETLTPRIDTIAKIAWEMGMTLELVKRRTKPKLSQVK